ncbi:MAG: acetyl-CoA carboxylase biotin carboxylase subunit [Candidatus Aminicenantes bacterium]|nr:acetyl-CoA carboxylase biotin carboxylase subunit [Candidatus Aminicenantes bacterium]
MTKRPRRLEKILIANRGEIAVRVERTCRELGRTTVAVFSDPDRHALHVRYADEAYPLGGSTPAETYLDQAKIFDIARRSGADAVHPGYGFLSENPSFAAACRERGLVFIGPSAESIELMGEKTRARERMSRAGVPIVPGTPPLAAVQEALSEARRLSFPVLIKAAAGGGGKGMRRVDRPDDFGPAFEACRREALSAFGDDRVYLEKYLEEPHHVEFQILADAQGRTIHLFERECSIQRRHQKIIEETPSPLMTKDLRARMGQAAVRAAEACGYTNAGTIEFLVDAGRRFYFLEMNTRLQVEHPITEMVTGVDLVERQIRIAEGEPLEDRHLSQRGTAMECRIYAEDPWNHFLPSPGLIRKLSPPGGPGVRDDTGVYAGFTVPMEYDPLLAKLVVWGENRQQTLARMSRALEEYRLIGIRTNIPYLRRIVRHPEFARGAYDTHFLMKHQDELLKFDRSDHDRIALAAAAVLAWRGEEKSTAGPAAGNSAASAWKMAGRPGVSDS